MGSILVRNTEMDFNFTCSRKKLSAIINVVLCGKSIKMMKDDLQNASTIAIHFDTTTLHGTKIIAIMAKYYDPVANVKVRCLDVRSIVTETAKDICDYIIEVAEIANLDLKKIKILCADNTNTNFGGSTQEGINNVAKKLEAELGHGLIRCGCLGHILNNAFSLVVKMLKEAGYFNLSEALNQPFYFFYQKVKICDKFKRFCLSRGMKKDEIQPLRKYGKTRWLSAYISLLNMTKMVPMLYLFFENEEMANRALPEHKRNAEITSNFTFFSNGLNRAWLLLMLQFSSEFYILSKKMQGRNSSLISGLLGIHQLIRSLKRGNRFIIDAIDEETWTSLSTKYKKRIQTAVDLMIKTSTEYLEQWLKPFGKFSKLDWVLLNGPLDETMVQDSLKESFGEMKVPYNQIDETNLTKEIEFINIQFEELNSLDSFKKSATSERWTLVFKSARDSSYQLVEMESIICDILAMSPTNAMAESIFSEIGHFWGNEKSKINFLNIFSFIMIRLNIDLPANQFAELIANDAELADQIRSSDKYCDLRNIGEQFKQGGFESSMLGLMPFIPIQKNDLSLELDVSTDEESFEFVKKSNEFV